ncbi:hypothetical protein CTI12_AA109800 [Artemisia annua]|uniref:Uncharacterized protein n=1 Tax=Artemisia annua TaxID=35608 RepID=A0A2U1PV57_ARTAN|nr:hypothetical protein CTI12_AA109800 [Artemisia annua]
MEAFPCLLDSLGTLNTSTKVDTATPNNNASNKSDDGSVNVLKNAKSTYVNLLNGEQRCESMTKPYIMHAYTKHVVVINSRHI